MSDKNWLIVGGIVIVVLLTAIVVIFLVPLKDIKSLSSYKNKPTPKQTPTISLNEDYSNPDNYPLITVNDIVDGTVLRSEKAKEVAFESDIVPLKFVRKDEGYNSAYLVIDESSLSIIKQNPTKLPFRNLYFYKIKREDKWYTILGQQVKNSDGSSSFLHFLVHSGKQPYPWTTNKLLIEPKLIVPDSMMNYFGSRDFFSADEKYYMKGGRVELLIDSWLKTGIVPDDLQKEILLLSLKSDM